MGFGGFSCNWLIHWLIYRFWSLDKWTSREVRNNTQQQMLGDILVTGTRFLNTFFILSTRASVHMVCYYYQECGLHVIIVTINKSVSTQGNGRSLVLLGKLNRRMIKYISNRKCVNRIKIWTRW